jgi:hypothetical protein
MVEDLLDANKVLSFPWPQSDDKGIDMVAFVVENDVATSFVMGLQVKSGDSYWVRDEGRVDVGRHKEYWTRSTLPVFAVTVRGRDVRIEDTWSAINRPDAGLAGNRIRCVAELKTVVRHVRMRARVQALAPELAGPLRTKLLAELDAENAFTAVAELYFNSAKALELDLARGLAQVVRWTLMDPDDSKEVQAYCAQVVPLANLLATVADACAQWALIWGAELASLRVQHNSGAIENDAVLHGGNPQELDELFALLEALLRSSGKAATKPSRTSLIRDVLQKLEWTDVSRAEQTGFLSTEVLRKIAQSSAASLEDAVKESKLQLYQNAGRYIADLKRAAVGQRNLHDDYARRLLLLVAPV